MSKRYVLLMAEADLSEGAIRDLQSTLDSRFGTVKLISVKGNPRAVIVKTTNRVAPLLREHGSFLTPGGKKLEAVLTSGAVGNLKKRALVAKADGQVSKR